MDRSELGRKLVHVGMGVIALALAFMTWWQAAACAALALAHNLFLLPLYGGRSIFRGEARVRGTDRGIVFYPLSVLLLVLALPHRLDIVAAAWMFMAVGDGMAGVVGRLAGQASGQLPWNRQKSWAGLLAFLAFGLPAALFALSWTSGAALDISTLVIVALVGLALALVESLETGINDNLLVPLAAGALLYAGLAVIEPDALRDALPIMRERLPWAFGVNLALGLFAWRRGSVDVSGFVHGTLLGTALWVFGGLPAFVALALFFFAATAATKLGWSVKVREGTAQDKGGARGAPHAWANTGAGVLFALLLVGGGDGLFAVAVTAAFATALADTLGSEIGQAYGRRTFLITTLRPVPRGTEGAVSLEGTLAGVAGAALIAAASFGLGYISLVALPLVVLAAFLGTTLESVIGALESGRGIDNETQNFLNTLAGGLIAFALALAIDAARLGAA